MEAYLLDWLNLLVRWLHLITGAAWVGASFYFVMLDSSLRPVTRQEDKDRGVFGDIWAVHGGGFYHSQKYLTGPRGEPLPDDLHWSKWEAYTTWLSGIALLAIVYWYGANTYLIDSNVLPLSTAAAIGISAGCILGGWLVYDSLCRLLAAHESLLAAIVFGLLLALDWGLFQVFGARAAYVHVGVVMGTIMVANVYFHIIPGQKKMVDAIRNGQSVDPAPGAIGKQRSVHNTYFTLPVLFIMISNHFPMTYSHTYGWANLGVIMAAGVLIRQYFVLRRRGRNSPVLLGIAVALLVGLAVAMAPRHLGGSAGKIAYADARAILDRRCVSCHAATPTQPGFAQAPKGILLTDQAGAKQHAQKIAETVNNRYMPIGNLTKMTDDERAALVAWAASGAPAE